MEPTMLLATFVGSLVGGLVGSSRSLHKVAKEAADAAVSAHEDRCQLRAVAARHLADEAGPLLTPHPMPLEE